MEQPDVTQAAAPSPAPVEVPTEPKAYQEWRQTGKLPDAASEGTPAESKPKPEAPAPSKESAPAGEQPEANENRQERKPKNSAETRLQEILQDLRTAGLSPAELKTFRREARPPEAPAQPKSEPPAKPAELKKPKVEDFETWDAYEEARDAYLEAKAEAKADAKAEERIRAWQEQQTAQAAQKAIAEKLSTAKERYGDEAETTIITAATAIMQDAEIPHPVKDVIDRSPVLMDLLHVLGSKPEDLAAFIQLAKTDPASALRKAIMLEQTVEQGLGGSPAKPGQPRGEDGKFAKSETTPPAKPKPAEAPPPPRELSGQRAAPPDEVEGAVKAGDFRAFQKAQNRRDMEARRGL